MDADVLEGHLILVDQVQEILGAELSNSAKVAEADVSDPTMARPVLVVEQAASASSPRIEMRLVFSHLTTAPTRIECKWQLWYHIDNQEPVYCRTNDSALIQFAISRIPFNR
jgi:hypothetical protein